MKLIKAVAAGATALALAVAASATTVKVTGSTAFRKALYVSIINQLATATGHTLADVKVAWYGNATMTSAAQAIFSNGTDTVQCCMAGSVGGINWIVNNGNVATVAPFDPTYSAKTATAWLSASNLPASGNVTAQGAAPGYSPTITGSVLASPAYDAASPADFTMSDSLQASTPYSPAATGVTLVNAGSANVGVVQFVFAKGQTNANTSAGDARFTNMTSLAFRNLANVGYEQLSDFTGNNSDDGYYVTLVGRDADSGTRLATAYETGYGTVTTSINQYKAYDSTNADVGSQSAGTIAYVTAVTGQVGYSGGGNVKNVLNATLPTTATIETGVNASAVPFIPVGYVGIGDVPTVGTGRILTYNGVTQSDVATQNGQYTFWTHEQAYYKSTLSAAQKTIADGIANGVKSTYATASGGVLEATMKANRAAEGAVVFRTI